MENKNEMNTANEPMSVGQMREQMVKLEKRVDELVEKTQREHKKQIGFVLSIICFGVALLLHLFFG